MAFNIQTTVELQKGVLGASNAFVSDINSGTITVVGSLTGPHGREIELTVNEAVAGGYQFKKWIIETIPIDKVDVATSIPYTTYDAICNPTQQNTNVSTSYFTDGLFLYEDQEGARRAPSGFYGIGSGQYYIHNINTGLQGPLVCGQSPNRDPIGGQQPKDETLV